MNLKNFFLVLFTMLLLASCGSSKKTTYSKKKKTTSTRKVSPSKLRNNLVKTAKKYNGVKYKAGGTTNAGMDCSGLVTTVFKENDIALPRSSVEQSRVGDQIKLKNVQPGDLLFFENNPNKRVINHVGMVIDIDGDEVIFMHSSTQKGVMISSMNEAYHAKTFVLARDVIK